MYLVNAHIEPHYPVKTKFLKNTVSTILGVLKVKGTIEVTISIVGDRKMRTLNKTYSGLDTSTDVLSFSQTERISSLDDFFVPPDSTTLSLGDIVISYPQAIKNAITDNVLVDEAISKLLIHGLLHLFGHDHQNPADKFAMDKFQDQILKQIVGEVV